ncbi:FAD-dependent oxidoreductase [Limnohabitans sp. B9-3]|uniref:FAD-dependent oxidoreductase n=1 Tax=Limnohabitans sp. B9-3 TaxID=1100707 RepID=UPI000CADDB60|nr:FAD-dependent oxidoreductase [Limnohabitans sp. B9-3]PIT77541.1 FAD-binding dehydrogenase [Limnohabitans sp. B9-3]
MNDTLHPLHQRISTDLSQLNDHDTVDLVVIGSGSAGFSAALNAAIDGARVLLVERTGHVGGTTAWSAATTWVPGTQRGLEVNPDDTPERVATFLNLAVGERSDPKLRQAFIDNGPPAIAKLEAHSALQFQVRMLHPDYLSELEGSVLRGRAIEPQPFDGKLLGPNLPLVRNPIPEFTVLGGMMVDRDDIFHLLRLTQNWKSFSYSVRIIVRHFLDQLLHPRSTRLVMGNAMIARMLYSYIQRDGLLVTNTEAMRLLQEGNVIQGVVLQQTLTDGSQVRRTVRCKGGVVMASGGFNRHATRRTDLLPGAKEAWCPAAPGHTGCAQDLAIQAGGQLGNEGLSHAFWAPVSTRQRTDGSTAVFPHFVMDRGKPGMITVDSQGQRYVNESTSYHLFGIAMQARHATIPSVPSWLVCDSGALKRYGIGMVRPGGKGIKPFLADGYLKQGNSLAELALQLKLPADKFNATVERFNAFADQGVDEDFQRGTTDYQRANGDATWHGPNPCLGALREGPFYAIALYPGDIGAATGLLTDGDARVLNAQGVAIDGLYAAGNDMHSIMGGVYPAPGITIGPAITFGYLAAKHALTRCHA